MDNNRTLLDTVLSEATSRLTSEIPWLTHAYGRAYPIIRSIKGKSYVVPSIYVGTKQNPNEYLDLLPDSKLGNFSFFWIDDPQEISRVTANTVKVVANYALIFWFDMRKVYGELDNRNLEFLKKQILDLLNGKLLRTSGRINVTRVFEYGKNIYEGFTTQEIDSQYLMHPYAGFRFEGKIEFEEPCQ